MEIIPKRLRWVVRGWRNTPIIFPKARKAPPTGDTGILAPWFWQRPSQKQTAQWLVWEWQQESRPAEVDLAVPWDVCWPTPGRSADKSQRCGTAWPVLCVATPRRKSHNCASLTALNRLWRARHGQHLTRTYTSLRLQSRILRDNPAGKQ